MQIVAFAVFTDQATALKAKEELNVNSSLCTFFVFSLEAWELRLLFFRVHPGCLFNIISWPVTASWNSADAATCKFDICKTSFFNNVVFFLFRASNLTHKQAPCYISNLLVPTLGPKDLVQVCGCLRSVSVSVTLFCEQPHTNEPRHIESRIPSLFSGEIKGRQNILYSWCSSSDDTFH